jgi:hypothetical protein
MSNKNYRSKLTAKLIDSVKTQKTMEAAIFMVSSCKFAIFRYRVLKTSDRGIMETFCGLKNARDNSKRAHPFRVSPSSRNRGVKACQAVGEIVY